MWRIKFVKFPILTGVSRVYNCTLTGVSVTKGRSFLCIARVTNVCNLKLIDLWHFGPPGCRPAQSDLFHYTQAQKQTGKYRNWRVLMRSRGQSHGEQAPITLVLPAVVHISKVFEVIWKKANGKCLFLTFTTILTVTKEEIWRDE